MTVREFFDEVNRCTDEHRAAELLGEAVSIIKTCVTEYRKQNVIINSYKEQVASLENELENFGRLDSLIERLESSAERLEKIDKPSSKKKKSDVAEKPQRHKYGEYKHVLLTGEQYSRLVQDFGAKTVDQYIKEVDEYCQQYGKSYSDYNLTIRNFIRRNNGQIEEADKHSYDVEKILEYSKNNLPKLN